MNRRRFVRASATLALGASLAGCGADEGYATPSQPVFVPGNEGASSVDTGVLREWLDGLPTGELSDTERADVRFMREEEKVARDVYLALYDAWGLAIHDTISDSEQTHMDAMLGLVETYDLEDPATGTVGTFTNDELQALYDDLVAWGRESALDSLEVGCRIEDKDMRDIQKRIDRKDERAITLVYENLLRGSRNHLRAFYRAVTRRDGDYEPVYISQERFDEIVTSDWETGRE